jgi:hypothetical protein
MDPNATTDPKTALDKALFDQMQKIQSKKRQSAKEKVQRPVLNFTPNFTPLSLRRFEETKYIPLKYHIFKSFKTAVHT